jgi:CubicO group peptidase (beta-lactamase class C family)
MREQDIPGAAVAVVVNGNVDTLTGFGVANIGTRTPVEADTVFQIGSVTKTLTAAALVILNDRGLVELHRPVEQYISGLHPSMRRLTAYQLLTHTAGLKDDWAYYGPSEESQLPAGIRSWDGDSFFTEPAEVFSYSNLGYSVAGLLIQEVTGKPFADAMHDLLFEPLGMRSTTFRPEIASMNPNASGHGPGKDGTLLAVKVPANNVVYSPSGFAYSTAGDLARFAIALMNGDIGRVGAERGWLLERMAEPQVTIPTGQNATFGLGVAVYQKGDNRMIIHDGVNLGFGAKMVIVPERNFAAISLSNRHGVFLNKALKAAMESSVPAAPPSSEPAPALIQDVSNVAGTYGHAADRIKITAEQDSLWLCCLGSERVRLTPLAGSRFSYTSGTSSAEVAFVPGVVSGHTYLHTRIRAYRKLESR